MDIAKKLEENEILLVLESNEVIPAERAFLFGLEIVRIAHQKQHFGPDAVIEIVQSGRGSFWAKIIIYGASVATIMQFAADIIDRHHNSTTRLPMCTASMMIDNGVTKLTAMTCQGSFEALREQIPAIDETLRRRTHNGQTVRISRTTGPHPITDEGRPVELKDGSVIFGTQHVPIENIRYIDDSRLSSESWPSGPDLMPAGKIELTSSNRRIKLALVGEFEREKNGIYYFKSGGSVFHVEFAASTSSSPPTGQSISITAELDPTRPELIRVVGIAI